MICRPCAANDKDFVAAHIAALLREDCVKKGKPSNTALIVAAGVQLASHDSRYRQLVAAGTAERGMAVLQLAHPTIARLLGWAWFRSFCRTAERITLPGMVLHLALRKQALRKAARTAVAAGCTQLVVLGAGYDTLCAELLMEYPQLRCIEIDHPATQRRKLGGRAPMDGPGQLNYLAADLGSQRLPEVLAACPSYAGDQKTLFVAEGLLMYLPLAAVEQLFAQVAGAARDSCIAFTWIEPQADGRPNFRKPSALIDWWLKLRGEPFLSGLARNHLQSFLRKLGFAPIEIIDHADAPAIGEYICIAAHGSPEQTCRL